MMEIRFHGRGGQGAVTAAEVLAVAAFKDGKYAQAFGKFGPERRGAPVQSFTRISDEPIRIRQEVYEPDCVVVLDASLMKVVDVREGLKEGGILIINTGEEVAGAWAVDATQIAMDVIGKPIVNTAMLGAFNKASECAVTLDSLTEAIKERFPGKIGELNSKAIVKASEGCACCEV
ncbi:MAG: pyruvate ferredoxin oxidoreductase subunit gamma [Candidatus Diapherotrites archaeon]|nr:pyruvate ferredoxin oxidoreductase subunit gamma [Candidatus Diapherotrites archaeon]